MNTDGHVGFFTPVIDGTGFQRLKDFSKLIPQEDTDDCGRSLAASETVIVSGRGHRCTEKILILIHGLDHRCQEKQELGAFMWTVTGIQEIIAGVGKHGPVVMLAAAVDPGKRLF